MPLTGSLRPPSNAAIEARVVRQPVVSAATGSPAASGTSGNPFRGPSAGECAAANAVAARFERCLAAERAGGICAGAISRAAQRCGGREPERNRIRDETLVDDAGDARGANGNPAQRPAGKARRSVSNARSERNKRSVSKPIGICARALPTTIWACASWRVAAILVKAVVRCGTRSTPR